MPRRHPPSLPAVWLFTDKRLGGRTLAIAALLPPGSGIVVRHDELPQGTRWRLMRRLVRIAKARRLLVLLAAPPAVARRWGADGVYLRQSGAHRAARAKAIGLPIAMPVHDPKEARTARRVRADIAFVSPLYSTQSHPGGPTLNHASFARLARQSGAQPMALGGMTAPRARCLRRQMANSNVAPGWAAIDTWVEKAEKRAATRHRRQKRNCVPI